MPETRAGDAQVVKGVLLDLAGMGVGRHIAELIAKARTAKEIPNYSRSPNDWTFRDLMDVQPGQKTSRSQFHASVSAQNRARLTSRDYNAARDADDVIAEIMHQGLPVQRSQMDRIRRLSGELHRSDNLNLTPNMLKKALVDDYIKTTERAMQTTNEEIKSLFPAYK